MRSAADAYDLSRSRIPCEGVFLSVPLGDNRLARIPPRIAAKDAPLPDRLLNPLGRILTPEVAERLVQSRFDRKTQAQIDKLARKCNEGTLTEAERRESKRRSRHRFHRRPSGQGPRPSEAVRDCEMTRPGD